MLRDLVGFALNQTVQLERLVEVTSRGEAIFGDSEDIRCRISYKNRLILNKDGDQVTSSAVITTQDSVWVGDRVTVQGQKFIVLSVSIPVTFDGTEHRRKVYI